MLRSLYLLRCRTCVNLKEILAYRKFTNTMCNESFQSRALKHFRSSTKLQKPLPHTYQISEEYYDNLLPRAHKTLESVYSDFKRVQNTKDQLLINTIFNDIDTKCFSIVHTLKPHQIFDLLTQFLQIYPRQIHTTYFYEKAISYLVNAAGNKQLSDQEVIQLLFYMSISRETARCYIEDLRHIIKDIRQMTLLEKCVIADCFFKAEVKFTHYESEELERVIEDEFDTLKKDPNLLIILCRALTSISATEELTLKKLSNYIVSSEEPWDFKILVNILNLYSKALLFEPKVIDCLVKYGIEAMKKDLESDTQQLDLHDISKFLKSLCNLGLTMNLDEKRILRVTVEKRFEEYRQVKNLSYFVNALLCLHVLQCWSTRVLVKCFQTGVFEPVYQNRYLWRVQDKLKLLLTQINLEIKMDIPKSLNKPIKSGYSVSNNIHFLREICQNLMEKNVVHQVEIECPIEALYIPGITLKTKKGVYHVDILDNATCLKNTNVPHGYMNLKLRLLSRLHMKQILIQKNFLEKPHEVEKYITGRIKSRQAATFHPKCIRQFVGNENFTHYMYNSH